MNKIYKNKLIGLVISIIVNFLIFLTNYLNDIKGLSALYVISLCFVCYYIIYWLYQLSRYAIFHLMFGNYKKQTTIKKIVFIMISILLIFITVFVILIEKPKYTTLNDKLQEKNTIKDIKVFNQYYNQFTDYNNYDFKKDKEYTIFGIEFNFLGSMKKYTIYKTDYRYQLLLAYLEIFNKKDDNRELILSYLALSYQAINYYKKEENEIKQKYDNLVKKYYQIDNKEEKLDLKAMVDIKDFLLNTKMGNIKYNDIIRQMILMPKFSTLEEVKKWHNYFQNESDKELAKVNKVLNDCNNHFQKEILSKYNNQDKNNY